MLHPASAYETSPFVHAPALAERIRPYNCEIVISSSWRFQYNMRELQKLLPDELAKRVTGVTGLAHIGSLARFHEIQNYLNRSAGTAISWRALDDSNWEFPPRQAELILCNPNLGVGEYQLRELEEWLQTIGRVGHNVPNN